MSRLAGVVKMLMRHRRVLAGVLILAGILLAARGWQVLTRKSAEDTVRHVRVVSVVRETLTRSITLPGTVRASRSTVLLAKSRGILDWVASPGLHVRRNDVIARIENPEIERALVLLRESVSIAKAQYERVAPLEKTGIESKSAIEDRKSAWLEAERRLAEATRATDDLSVRAPFDGVVGIFKRREGSQVLDGEALVTLYDPQSLLVEFDLPLTVALALPENAPVQVEGARYRLTHVQKMLDEDTHMCPAYVNVDCKSCLVGATILVNLTVEARKKALVIPRGALFLQDGRETVYLVREGRVVSQPVKTGLLAHRRAEVLSGLREGDQVIPLVTSSLYPGLAVVAEA